MGSEADPLANLPMQRAGPGVVDLKWREQLGLLALQCLEAETADVPALLTDVHQLLTFAPETFSGLIGEVPERSTFAALIAIEAFESAVFRLLPRNFGYMISRGPEQTSWLASSCLGGREDDVTCRARSITTALLGAYLYELAGFGASRGNFDSPSIPN